MDIKLNTPKIRVLYNFKVAEVKNQETQVMEDTPSSISISERSDYEENLNINNIKSKVSDEIFTKFS